MTAILETFAALPAWMLAHPVVFGAAVVTAVVGFGAALLASRRLTRKGF